MHLEKEEYEHALHIKNKEMKTLSSDYILVEKNEQQY